MSNRCPFFTYSAVFGSLLAFAVPTTAAPPSPSLESGVVSLQCVMNAYERLGESLRRCERRVEAKVGPRKFEALCVFKAHFQHSLDVARCDDPGVELGGAGTPAKL